MEELLIVKLSSKKSSDRECRVSLPKYVVLSVLLVLRLSTVYSQQTLTIKSRNAASKLHTYVQRADSLYNHEQFIPLFRLTQEAIPLAVALKAVKDEAHLYYQLGMVYRHQRALAKTISVLQKTCQLSAEANDLPTQAKSMYVIATVYNDQGNYEAAITQCLTNLSVFKKQQFVDLELYTYDLLTTIYNDLEDKAQSNYYLAKVLAMADRVKTPSGRVILYTHQAQYFENKGDYRAAWPYRAKAVNTAKQMTPKSMPIAYLIEAATNLRKQRRLEQAMQYIKEADQISQQLSGKGAVGGLIWNEMALIFIELGQYKHGLRLAQRYVAYAKSKKIARDIMTGLGTLALAQERAGLYREAIQSYKNQYILADKLKTTDKLMQVARIRFAYELEKKGHIIQLLQKKRQLDKLKTKQQAQALALANQEKWLYIEGGIFLLLVVGLIGYFLQRLYRAQQSLKRKKREIEQQAQQLRENNRLKDQLFAIVSHDLRGPILSLKLSLSLQKIQDRSDDELADLEHKIDGLVQILDNVLYWSLSQQNGLRPRPQNLPVEELIEDILTSFKGLIGDKQLIVTDYYVPAAIWADETMTLLVLRNILHNAIKYTPSGGFIHVWTEATHEQVKVHITDSGIGMDLSDSGTYQQAYAQGTGIGLNLSRELMQLNGGQVELKSQPGQGTSVTLVWPGMLQSSQEMTAAAIPLNRFLK